MSWGYTLEKVWISCKIWAMKARFMLIRVVALAGLLLAVFGAYAAIRPDLTLPPSSSIVGMLPAVEGVTPFDGILLFFFGIIVAALTTRT